MVKFDKAKYFSQLQKKSTQAQIAKYGGREGYRKEMSRRRMVQKPTNAKKI